MNAVAVIPARYASERFCGKPLAKDTGKFLIQHVCEKVVQAPSLGRVIVATDDERIRSAVESFGGECVMTRRDHPSGTDRIAEVARTLDCDIVVNVQGDEPEIEPSAIETLLQIMQDGTDPVATLACSFDALHRDGLEADPNDPNCVKVVVANGRAIYFSRSLVPYPRKRDAGYDGPYLHLGIYAYRRDVLLKLSELEPTALERTEGLEQLRILEHGYTIGVGLVEHACVGIDTPADYAAFVRRYRESSGKTEGAVAVVGRRPES